VKKPEQFDVIVTTNMNGDIISDLTSALVGGLGFAPSANLGTEVAIFEAVHGSAPKYAGKNCINPTAVIGSAVMMLRHLGELEAASRIENAILATLEDGKVQTGDVVGYNSGKAGTTSAFTDAIIANLGRTPKAAKTREYRALKMPTFSSDIATVVAKTRRVVGADIFVETSLKPQELGQALTTLAEGTALKLKMISNRGTQVFPDRGTMIDCVDQYRCRFIQRDANGDLNDAQLVELLSRVGSQYRWMHVEKLQEFDGQPSFTKAQGED
jgi:isocitrate dehydrogenase